jgi:hypothetical protein
MRLRITWLTVQRGCIWLTGWRCCTLRSRCSRRCWTAGVNQQLARNLALSTITQRATRLRVFLTHAEVFPWQWTPQQADEWFGDLRAVRGCAHSSSRWGQSKAS